MCLAISNWSCKNVTIKNCDLASNTHAIFFLNDNDSAMSITTVSHRECQWIVRSTFCHCPCWWIRGSAIIMLPMWTLSFTDIHWQNTRCSSSTDAYDVKQVLKTFKSAFMLLLVQKEQHSLFNHTSLFLCYRHLNNRSTRDALNDRQQKLWPNKREGRINCTEQWCDTIKWWRTLMQPMFLQCGSIWNCQKEKQNSLQAWSTDCETV